MLMKCIIIIIIIIVTVLAETFLSGVLFVVVRHSEMRMAI